MKELRIDAKIENLDAVLAFVEAELCECTMKQQRQIAIAVEEIFVNIAHYAYAPDTGGAVIRVRRRDTAVNGACGRGDEVVIEFEDNGKPYNPLEKRDPDITLGVEEREVGGLGIFMVKKIMDSVEYRRGGDKNILTIKMESG